MIRTKEWLKKQREKAKLTQKELADNTGISVNAIRNIEQGQRLGSIETWTKIERFFNEENCSFEYTSLIASVKNDIEHWDETKQCFLYYVVVDNHIVINDYSLEKPSNNTERVLTGTLKQALDIFENENKLIN